MTRLILALTLPIIHSAARVAIYGRVCAPDKLALDKNPEIQDYECTAMDKQLSGFDPKLQETFNRVMSTPVPAPAAKPVIQTPPSGMPTIAAPTTSALPPPAVSQTVTQPTQPQAEVPNIQSPEPQKVVIIPPQETEIKNSQIFSSKKKAGKISPVILGLGVVVFLLVYTLVWVKIFGLSLPFLP